MQVVGRAATVLNLAMAAAVQDATAALAARLIAKAAMGLQQAVAGVAQAETKAVQAAPAAPVTAA